LITSPRLPSRAKSHRGRRLLSLLAGAALLLAASGKAQELKDQPTPFSVWLDFHAQNTSKPDLPIWFDSLTTESVPSSSTSPARTLFRLRFRQITSVNSDLLLRLFFDDLKGAGVTVSGWSETGSSLFERGPLGDGVGLPTSENLTLPMAGVDYVEISVNGDGSAVRGVFLASLKPSRIKQPIDYPVESSVADAFGNLPPALPQSDDFHLFGRVKATIDPGIMTLTPATAESGTWQFQLETPPLVAVVAFEILDADPEAPPEIIVNNQPLGAANVHLPDLADPAFLGLIRPLENHMHFRYTGWLHAQKLIPASALQAGLNTVVVQLNKESGPIAVRSVELQLKYHTAGLDFTISTSSR